MVCPEGCSGNGENINCFNDTDSSKTTILHKVKNIIFKAKTKFQDVKMVEFENFGKSLILDGIIQSSMGDEFMYSELLVQPAMIANSILNRDSQKKVLILGGGEGATSREVLKHKDVAKVVMIDIDGELVNACKKYFPEMHQGAFDDKRHELRIGDAIDYLKKTDEKYDVIIGDLVDPKSELARLFYTKAMFKKISRMLHPHGIFVTQSADVTNNIFAQKDNNYLTNIYQLSKGIFKHVDFSYEYIPSFSDYWSWILCSDEISADKISNSVDDIIKEKGIKLRYYNSETHKRSFSISKDIKDFLTRK